MIKVSVLIPAYNEEATICTILERVRAQKVPGAEFEVIVIDDGSIDRTGALLDAHPALYDRLMRLPTNGGKGAAVKAGLWAATGDYVLFQDADIEYDPGDYTKLLLPVLRYDADAVMGSRFVAPEFTRVYYFWHKAGNFLITLIFNILNNSTFTDVYSCYLIYRRSLVNPDELVSDGWDQHAEILSRVAARAKRMYEVPISYHGRTYEEGKKIKAYHAASVIWRIVATRVRCRRAARKEPKPCPD
jgi:glycosyltransferase involved in cell wall biosynthesis